MEAGRCILALDILTMASGIVLRGDPALSEERSFFNVSLASAQCRWDRAIKAFRADSANTF